MTQRSNQFNLRTTRYTDAEIEHLYTSSEYITLAFRLKDNFGEHGLIAVVLLKKEPSNILFIDTWLMSCRVLKRGMEEFVLNEIIKTARIHNFKTICYSMTHLLYNFL